MAGAIIRLYYTSVRASLLVRMVPGSLHVDLPTANLTMRLVAIIRQRWMLSPAGDSVAHNRICRVPPRRCGTFLLNPFKQPIITKPKGSIYLLPYQKTTFTIANHGCLGNRNDEGRSEMRYVVWIAEFSESSNPWTHMALPGIPGSMPVWVSVTSIQHIPLWVVSGRLWSVPLVNGGSTGVQMCLLLICERNPVWYSDIPCLCVRVSCLR